MKWDRKKNKKRKKKKIINNTKKKKNKKGKRISHVINILVLYHTRPIEPIEKSFEQYSGLNVGQSSKKTSSSELCGMQKMRIRTILEDVLLHLATSRMLWYYYDYGEEFARIVHAKENIDIYQPLPSPLPLPPLTTSFTFKRK